MYVRKIIRIDNSYYVGIPKSIMGELHLLKGFDMTVRLKHQTIEVRTLESEVKARRAKIR